MRSNGLDWKTFQAHNYALIQKIQGGKYYGVYSISTKTGRTAKGL